MIQPQEIIKLSDGDLYYKAQKLAEQYADDISDKFPEQLITLRSCLKSKIERLTSVKQFAKLLLIENATLSTSFPDVCTALMLFLTIPVTVAAAERSFSKLKLIKTYLRNTMGQERLSHLSLLSIEHGIASSLKNSLDEIISTFAEAKTRRKIFY